MAVYIYAGIYAEERVWKIDPSDMSRVAWSPEQYGANIMGVIAFDGFIYMAGMSPPGKVWKIDPSDLSKVAESVQYGHILGLTGLGSYVYAGGYTQQKVWKLNASDLVKVDESIGYGGNLMALTALDGYIYAGGATTQKIWKIDPATMNKVAESIDLGEQIMALAGLDGFIYAIGSTVQKVWKLNASDLDKVDESADYGGHLRAVIGYEGFIYITGQSPPGKVWKIDPSDMSKVAESIDDYGGNLTGMGALDGYIYVGGYITEKIWQLNVSDLVKVGESMATGTITKGIAGFEPEAAPEVTTDPALWIGPTSATLNGTLDHQVAAPSDCGFEWGETVPYSETTPTEEKSTGETFSQVITGLLPNTLYHFRAIATGPGTGHGADRTFTTAVAAILPTVTTDPATGRGARAATLNGTLNQDGGEDCECGIEWGLDTGYGTTTSPQTKTTGETFSQALAGLHPGTTYHFRVFATNSVGTSYGADRSFTTALIITKAYALARQEL